MKACDGLEHRALSGFLMALFVLLAGWHFVVVQLGVLPRPALLLIDGLCVVMGLWVLLRLRAWWPAWPGRYRALAVVLAVYAVLNLVLAEGTGIQTLQGLRQYGRFLPLVCVPWLLYQSPARYGPVLGVLAGLLLLQMPLSLLQRFSVVSETGRADFVVGTLHSAGLLTVTLYMAVAMGVAWGVRRVLPTWLAVLWVVALFVPTAINESKAVLFLLPVAIGVPLVVAWRQTRVPARAGWLLVLAGLLTVFVPVYDHFNRDRWGYGLVGFFLHDDGAHLKRYLFKGARQPAPPAEPERDVRELGEALVSTRLALGEAMRRVCSGPEVRLSYRDCVAWLDNLPRGDGAASPPAGLTAEQVERIAALQREKSRRHRVLSQRIGHNLGVSRVGKMASIRKAWHGIGNSVRHRLFGFGLGATALSSWDRAEGVLAREVRSASPDKTTLAVWLWELGLVGIGLLGVAVALVARDAFRLAWRTTGRDAALATGWLGLMAVAGLGLAYKNLMDAWFLFGGVCWLTGLVMYRAAEHEQEADRG